MRNNKNESVSRQNKNHCIKEINAYKTMYKMKIEIK